MITQNSILWTISKVIRIILILVFCIFYRLEAVENEIKKKKIDSKTEQLWRKRVANQINLKLSLPIGNLFYLNKGNGYDKDGGFYGITTGCEYHVTDKKSISLNAGVVINFPFPIPGENFDDTVSTQLTSALFISFQQGGDFFRLHYDIGFQINNTTYYDGFAYYNIHKDTVLVNKSQLNIGFALSSYYRINKYLNIGFNYYPSFLYFDKYNPKFHYSHFLFIEFLLTMPIYKPKN